MRFLNPNGFIFMHDCNPRHAELQCIPKVHNLWLGDTWKVAVALRAQDYLDIVIGDFDLGVGVLRRRLNENRIPIDMEDKILHNALEGFTYEEFDRHRDTLLRLRSFTELKQWISNKPLEDNAC